MTNSKTPWFRTIALAIVLLAPVAFAANTSYTWDGNTGTAGAQDGGGTWDASTTADWLLNGAGSDVLWPNASGTTTTATIGAASGAAGTIAVSGTVSVNTVQFNAPGSGTYTLGGAGTLSFGGTTPTISIAASQVPVINTILGESSTGTAVKFTATSSGSGSITLGGASTFTGSPTISQATVIFATLANGGIASPFGAGANTVPIIVGNNGSAAIATYTGAVGSTDRPWTVGGASVSDTINNSGTGAISFNNNGTMTAGTAGTRTLTLGGSYTGSANTFAELVSDMTGFTTTLRIGNASSTASTWNITGANTHTGGTSINVAGSGAVLNIGNASALGSGPFTFGASGSFDNTTTGDITVNNAFTLSGGSPTYIGSAHNMTINGPVTLSVANRTVTITANTLTLGGQITGAFTLTKAGAGTLVLNNAGSADTHNGTLISAGTLDLGGTSQSLGAVTFSGAATTQNGTINGSSYSSTLGSGIATVAANLAAGVVSLSHSGSGTLLLSGVNAYSGGTTISGAGTLLITNDTGLGDPSGAITFSGSGFLGSTNNAPNAGAVTNAIVIASSRTITVNSAIIAGLYTADTNNLIIAAKITGAGSVIKKSSGFSLGNTRFSNDTSDYTGDFTAGFGNTEFTSVADQGTASSLGKGAAGTGGTITLTNASSSGTLRYVGSGSSTTHRPLSWGGLTATYTLDASGSGPVQFLSTSVLKVGSGSAELRLRGTNTGANTLAHVINDLGGVTTVTKLDSGAWILSGANTFSGGVTINGGILQVNAAETPGTSGPLGKSGAITNSGGTLQYSAANNFDYSSRFSSGVNQIIKIDCNAQNVTFASTIGNSGSSLTVSSSTPGGSLTLLGVNSNITTVASGTLLVNGDSSAPTNNYTVASGATLGGTGKIGGTVTYQSGSLAAFTNGATLIISGSLVANGNTVHLRLPAALGAGTYTLATYNPTGGSGSFATNPVIDSGSLAAGTSASITTGGGTVSLVICSASANPVTYTATKGLQFKLNESDLLTNATGSGGVNLTSVQSPSANGVSITRSGGIIFYNGPLTNDDSFTYTVTSGTGGCTAANTVTMRAVNGLGPAQIAAPSNGVVTITFFGIPGYSYAVDTTTDVIVGAWSAIETNIAGTNGSWIFTDLNATNAQQYYRLRQP